MLIILKFSVKISRQVMFEFKANDMDFPTEDESGIQSFAEEDGTAPSRELSAHERKEMERRKSTVIIQFK